MRWVVWLIACLALATACYALDMPSSCTGVGKGFGYDTTMGTVCNNPLGPTVSRLGVAKNVSVTVGALSLGTKTVTVTGITGVQANDVCISSLAATQGVTVGLVLAGCRASGTDQVDLIFSTPLALGISAGTIIVDIHWIG